MTFILSKLQIPLIVALSLALVSGCKSPPPVDPGPPVSHYGSTEPTLFPARRVVMLPLTNLTQHGNVGHEFDKLLAAELRTTGAFDLIVPAPGAVPAGFHLAGHSLFDDQTLAFVARKYHADAVILGRISHFHPYWPPSISVSLHCVDVRDGTVLASVDGNWDARNKFTARQAHEFFTLLHPQHPLPASELTLHSPSYFQKFVAHQIAQRFFTSLPRATEVIPMGD